MCICVLFSIPWCITWVTINISKFEVKSKKAMVFLSLNMTKHGQIHRVQGEIKGPNVKTAGTASAAT
jgi:hypothetical protein